MKSIGIIGYGRFGQVLAKLLANDYQISVYDKTPVTPAHNITPVNLNDIMAQQTLFIAVPIGKFTRVIQQIAPQLRPGTTVIDVCSVKVHPVQAMLEYLPSTVDIIATHPMFGPDSIALKNNLRIMMQVIRDNHGQYQYWKQVFQKKSVQIIEMTADEHDQMAAHSQGVTHFLGRVLKYMQAQPSPIDTAGYRALLQVMEQTCHDSWELFHDLQCYNPHSTAMIAQLREAIDATAEAIEKPRA